MSSNAGEDASSDPRLEEQHAAMEKLRAAKVLLVEDNEVNQELAVELLANSGVGTIVCNNGAEALEKINSML